MHIVLAADHAGFELKEALKKFLTEQGHVVEDRGAHEFDEQDDYPDFIIPAAKKIIALQREHGEAEVAGIIIGGSGQGEAIAANKIKGIRAAVYYGGPTDIVILSKQHNNANVLSLGARFMSIEEAKQAVETWLETSFDGGRHERRLAKLDALI